eukprot:gb/GECH01003657.1/.p1 GENE.gb/GECH01003657.1/~~gb/GECH01003657.1/.p1  ORF type:complete len:531 (+),score=166.31 gb/GECH01003657.1/:1-1593(+)
MAAPAESEDTIAVVKENLEELGTEDVNDLLEDQDDKDEALTGMGYILGMLRDQYSALVHEMKQTPENDEAKQNELKELKQKVTEKYRNTFETFHNWTQGLQAQQAPFSFPSKREKEQISEVKEVIAKAKFDLAEDDPGNNIIFQENNPLLINGATLDKLVEILVYRNHKYFKFESSFFLLYTAFTTPAEVLGKLVYIFRQSVPENNKTVMARIIELFEHWVSNHIYDFDFATVGALIEFLDNEAMATSLKQRAESAKEIILQFRDEAIRNGRMRKDWDLMDWTAHEIAEQLTILEFRTFAAIKPRECLGNSWTKDNREQLAPNLSTMIDRVNKTARWVTTSILNESGVNKRSELMTKFIDVATELYSLNNFNGLYEIVAGLSNAAVYRLNRSWDKINDRSKQRFKFFEKLVAPPYDNIKKVMATAKPPSVPMIGKYLFDFTFIEENSKDLVVIDGEEKPDMINFAKTRRFANLLRDIHMYQQTPYSAMEIPYLQNAFSSSIFDHLLSEDEAYNTSLKLEPRKRASTIKRS